MPFARSPILSPSSLTRIVRSFAFGTLKRILRLALGHPTLMQRPSTLSDATFSNMQHNSRHHQRRANEALVPTAGAALSPMLSVTLTRHPISTLTPAPAVGTA